MDIDLVAQHLDSPNVTYNQPIFRWTLLQNFWEIRPDWYQAPPTKATIAPGPGLGFGLARHMA